MKLPILALCSIIVAILCLISCQQPDGERTEKEGYDIVIIDSCQYIEVASGLGPRNAYYGITHKGNCNNPIHKYN